MNKHQKNYDIAIVGGGINGVGIAADAATRGLNVLLCEQNDLGSATSSASSKLIHGGLRYLEQCEFKLVAQALNERENLLFRAKHLVKPLTFILPHQPKRRSHFLIRLGLFLYDRLARRSSLPKTHAIHLGKHLAGQALKPEFRLAFEYSDCCVDDARLVIANALHAHANGATILNYVKCTQVRRTQDGWIISLYDQRTQQTDTIQARILINATGPWAQNFVTSILGLVTPHSLRLVKGSHIIVPKFYEGNFAYLLQHTDTRVIFVIPYLQKFCLIGTTDVLHTGEPGHVAISDVETTYLLQALQQYFNYPITLDKIIHSYAGIRPLLDNPNQSEANLTRDYTIEINEDHSNSPLISIFGGKITTYRKLAEKVVNKLQPYFPNLPHYQENSMILPGSHYKTNRDLVGELSHKYPWLPDKLLTRYTDQYGSDTARILVECHQFSDLGLHFGATLYQKEVDYLLRKEWAYNAEDILWRRTKLGYFFDENHVSSLNEYCNNHAINKR
jgi:glycerol-3-phosphate dehydrogenase